VTLDANVGATVGVVVWLRVVVFCLLVFCLLVFRLGGLAGSSGLGWGEAALAVHPYQLRK
jgi:hypothetical protein